MPQQDSLPDHAVPPRHARSASIPSVEEIKTYILKRDKYKSKGNGLTENRDRGIDEKMCTVLRAGCRDTFNAKLDTLKTRIDSTDTRIELANVKIDSLKTNVDSLKTNELDHLSKELAVIRKEKRAPWGRKEWSAFVSTAVLSITAIFVALINYLKP